MNNPIEPSQSVGKVSFLFDQMAAEYDQLRDPWYAWLFSRLHYFIAKNLLSRWAGKRQRVLDIGCGTGFQSFLYALTGADVTGVDISQELLAVAQEKNISFRRRFPFSIFPAHFDFVIEYDQRISDILEPRFKSAQVTSPTFLFGDATKLPFGDDSFDHVNCCGSTLNFVDDYLIALKEMARVLRPGGSFVIEVDAKYNCDLFWPLIDSTILFGKLSYDTTIKEAFGAAFSKVHSHVAIQYPFGEVEDPVYMDLRLFEKTTLLKEMSECGLDYEGLASIHSVTNLIPSTFLDTVKPSRLLKIVFAVLSRIEEVMPVYVPGCSLVVYGKKRAQNCGTKVR